jgi:cation diffusion facilitator CzcD-associated flavoprotein CzcO
MKHSLDTLQSATPVGQSRRDVLDRYREERDKRLHPDPKSQYEAFPQEVCVGSAAASPVAPTRKDKLSADPVCVTIVGAGFAGLLAGARLREAGVGSIRYIEKGESFGGTWYWNRYPGAQADTASLVYMPLLEETGHVPTERYAHGPEILEHCGRAARQFGLDQDVHFGSALTTADWDEAAGQWLLTTDRGIRFVSRFVVFALGQFTTPRRPAISGWQDYAGHVFHTANWDYAYTGGDAGGALMTGLSGKAVGIIGTGATAVQCIPHLAKAARKLFVFQRTPSAVSPRDNGPIDADWFRQIAQPGWQKKWLLNFVKSRDPRSTEEDLVSDGWTAISCQVRQKLHELPVDEQTDEVLAQLQLQVDMENMDRIRARVGQIVQPPEISEALKPWYFQFCKRPCFHDAYLPTFNRPNVELVDTKGQGIARVTRNGLVVGQTEYPLDCIIVASGFASDPARRFDKDIRVTGRGGRTLSRCWRSGIRTLHGIHVHGFPNAFHIQPVQAANLLSNIPHNLFDSAETTALVIGHALKTGKMRVEARASAQRKWIELLRKGTNRLANDSCTPGNFNNEGQLDDPRFRLNLGYPHGAVAFFRHMEGWRSDGRYRGLGFS